MFTAHTLISNTTSIFHNFNQPLHPPHLPCASGQILLISTASMCFLTFTLLMKHNSKTSPYSTEMKHSSTTKKWYCTYVCTHTHKHKTISLNFLLHYFRCVILTFRGPCILIYSYNKSQRDAPFPKFILIKNSKHFGQIYYPSSGVSTLSTQQ